MQVLDKKEIESRLQRLEEWTLEGDSIKREWIFQDFSEAMDFLNMVAVIVEKHNHHPEIHNIYNEVTL